MISFWTKERRQTQVADASRRASYLNCSQRDDGIHCTVLHSQRKILHFPSKQNNRVGHQQLGRLEALSTEELFV